MAKMYKASLWGLTITPAEVDNHIMKPSMAGEEWFYTFSDAKAWLVRSLQSEILSMEILLSNRKRVLQEVKNFKEPK